MGYNIFMKRTGLQLELDRGHLAPDYCTLSVLMTAGGDRGFSLLMRK